MQGAGWGLAAILWCLGIGACASSDAARSGSGGAPSVGAGGGGTAGAAGLAGNSSGGAGSAGAPSLCPFTPALDPANSAQLELPISLAWQQQAVAFAQENALPDGRHLVPLNVRLYISQVTLTAGNAAPVHADLVTGTGATEPYGIHFYSAEDNSTRMLRVRAPAGNYSSISFVLGLSEPCNQLPPAASQSPLDDASQMTWPHTGHLFLRYEGRVTSPVASAGSAGTAGGGAGAAGGGAGTADGSAGAAGTAAKAVTAVHMGGSLFDDLAPRVALNGAFTLPAASPNAGLRLDLEQVFKGALTAGDLSHFDASLGEEAMLGENVRQAFPSLHVLTLKP